MIIAIQFPWCMSKKLWYYHSTAKNMEVLWDIFLFEMIWNQSFWFSEDNSLFLLLKEEQIRLHMVSFCLQPRLRCAEGRWYVHHMFAWTHAAPLILPRPRACMCCVSESLERLGSDSSSLQIFQLKGTAHTIFCPIKISSALFIYLFIYLFVCMFNTGILMIKSLVTLFKNSFSCLVFHFYWFISIYSPILLAINSLLVTLFIYLIIHRNNDNILFFFNQKWQLSHYCWLNLKIFIYLYLFFYLFVLVIFLSCLLSCFRFLIFHIIYY